MARFEKRKVTKPYHLTTKEYQELFKEYEALGQNVIVVALNPLKNTTIISPNKKADETERLRLANKGFKVISIGEAVKEVKIGDKIIMTEQNAIRFSMQKEINVKGAFPSLRTFTMITVPEHFCDLKVVSEDTIIDEEVQINMDLVDNDGNTKQK